MAIGGDMKKTIKICIKEFVDDQMLLKEYSKVDNLSAPNYDAKFTIKIGKRINRNLELILQSQEGINEFQKLLTSENDYIKFLVARFLYPVMKKESMSIMKNYLKTLKDKIEIFEVKTVIEGLKNNQKVFVDQFKKLYGCDDLDSLNQEKGTNKE